MAVRSSGSESAQSTETDLGALKVITLSPTRRPSGLPTSFSDEGQDTSEPADVETEFGSLMDEIERSEDEGREAKPQRAKPKKARKAPEGARASKSSKALERVPKIEILTDADEIVEKGLRGRAGRYYKDAQTLFINGLYSAVDRMVADLEPELRGQGEPEVVRAASLKASQRFMAFRVGKATCYAISKRLSEDWSSDDLDRATSPESLSMAADDYKQSLKAAKRWANDFIKAASMQKDDAA